MIRPALLVPGSGLVIGKLMDDNMKLVEVCALWEKEAKSGVNYHSGRLTLGSVSLPVFLFKNTNHREGDARPALRLMTEVPKTEAERGGKEPQT